MPAEESFSPTSGVAANATAQSNESLQLRQYWHTILERRWLIISAFTFVFVLAAIYAFRATPIYEATARLQIDREMGNILNVSQQFTFDSKEQDYLQTQYRNLASRTLAESVINKLKLADDDRYKKAQDPVKAVLDDVNVVPIRLTRLVDIKVTHPVPKRAQDIANMLVENFLQQNQERKIQKATQALRILRDEAKNQEDEYTAAVAALHKYRLETKMASLNSEQDVVRQTYKQAQADYDAANSRYNEARKTADEAARWIKEGRDVADLKQMSQDTIVTRLRDTINQSEAALASLLTKYKDKHPSVISARKVIESDRAKLAQEAERVYGSIAAESDLYKAKLDQAKNELVKREQEINRLNALSVEYDVLNRKTERARFMYETVLARMKEFDMSSKDAMQNMSIVDSAPIPLRPVKPNRILVLLAGFVGGLGMALGLAFFVNFLDDSVKSQEDVDNYLRVPFLGYVPNIKTTSVVERDLQAHLHPTSSAAEGFRTLRAAVSLARNSDRLRTIAVTSTIPSEGKSLVASNYAIVSAQSGLKTLLIDADLRRPSVHKAFQLQSPVGLSSYLAERIHNVDEFVHKSDVPNLDVVCCGATPSNPSELVGSKRMLKFLEEVAAKYDRVVIDCPPVSAVADPLIVGAMADGVIFVTKFNKIRREHALRSIQRLQDAGIYLVGLVLNDIDFEGKDSYYYSYHYYQNRYYATHYKTRQTATVDAPKKEKDTVKTPASKV
jgi:succinoglycan biosynthesis transport protein ExoP